MTKYVLDDLDGEHPHIKKLTSFLASVYQLIDATYVLGRVTIPLIPGEPRLNKLILRAHWCEDEMVKWAEAVKAPPKEQKIGGNEHDADSTKTPPWEETPNRETGRD